MASEPPISLKAARQVLGVGARASPGDLRRAFRDAAKRAHPDRAGGADARFRQLVDAYHRLHETAPATVIRPPAPRAPEPAVLIVDPLVALRGGAVTHQLTPGRTLRIHLPLGLRGGDTVRVGGADLRVALRGTSDILVRGDDLWISVPVAASTLAQGGRIALETPLGRRIVWLTREAGERRLLRLVGQGLPARGSHRRGDLFLRLAPQAGETHSAARVLLRRFTAAWAA